MGGLPPGFQRLASGAIRWRVSVNGVRYTGTEPTLARARLARAQAELNAGGAPVESPTVDELLEGFIATARRAETTTASWRWARRYLPEPFTRRTVREVTPTVVAALWRQLEHAGTPPHAMVKLRNLCSQAWQEAIVLGATESNPWRVIAPPSPPAAAEIDPPTPEQVRRVIGWADGQLALWLTILARIGARGGEVCALRWRDIDVKAGEIRIGRNVTRSGAVTDGKTGRGAWRRVPIDKELARMLRKAERVVGCEWVFTANGVDPRPPDRYATELRQLQQTHGVAEPISPHDLRHFAVTQMLAAGVHVTTVAYIIGDNPRTVMSTYAHWIPAHGREAVEQLARTLDGVG